jgi:hypothetical protein
MVTTLRSGISSALRRAMPQCRPSTGCSKRCARISLSSEWQLDWSPHGRLWCLSSLECHYLILRGRSHVRSHKPLFSRRTNLWRDSLGGPPRAWRRMVLADANGGGPARPEATVEALLQSRLSAEAERGRFVNGSDETSLTRDGGQRCNSHDEASPSGRTLSSDSLT